MMSSESRQVSPNTSLQVLVGPPVRVPSKGSRKESLGSQAAASREACAACPAPLRPRRLRRPSRRHGGVGAARGSSCCRRRRGEPRSPHCRRPPARDPPRGEGKLRCRGPRLPVDAGAPHPRPARLTLVPLPRGAEPGPACGPHPLPGPAWPRRSPGPVCPRPHRLLTGNADKLNTAGITAICSGYRCRY